MALVRMVWVHPSPKVMADFFQTQKLTWCPHPICTIFGGCIKCMQAFKLDGGIMLILCLKKSAITFDEGCIAYPFYGWTRETQWLRDRYLLSELSKQSFRLTRNVHHIEIYNFLNKGKRKPFPQDLVGHLNKWRFICKLFNFHDDVIKWKHFMCHWPFGRGIHRSPVDSLTKASDAELWCSSWYMPEQTVEQAIKTPVIWDANALIMTSLKYWRLMMRSWHGNAFQHYSPFVMGIYRHRWIPFSKDQWCRGDLWCFLWC